MPSDRATDCFQNIITALDFIELWVRESGGIDDSLFHDAKTRSAIERQLLIVSEAAIRLDKLDQSLAMRLAPDIDWAGIRGMGNFIRHKYDDLDTELIADVLRNRLDELRRGCMTALKALSTS